ncbi:hypothetical protein AAC387_Pa09g1227 [Persea americana]
MASGNEFTIEMFTRRNNFSLWQRRMKDVLVHRGLKKDKYRKKPKKMFIEDWEGLEEKAINVICLTICDDVLFNVMNIGSAMKLWAKLESIYMSKLLTNNLFLKKQLYSLKMMEGSWLLEHLNEFNRIVTQLLSIDVKNEGQDKALLFFSSLPPLYEHMVITLMYEKYTLEIDEVQTREWGDS